jgi:hypothetical protein
MSGEFPMDEYLRANQKLWNEWTEEHEKSPFYDVEGFKAGKERLKSIELEELGMCGRLLHLQCHFGLNYSWERHGAIVTGTDLSTQSHRLVIPEQELNIPAKFVCSDVLTLPDVLEDQFDITFALRHSALAKGLNRWAGD